MTTILPQQIPPQGTPLDTKGSVFLSLDWYLFFYNVALQTLSQGIGTVPISPIDLMLIDAEEVATIPDRDPPILTIDPTDIDASAADLARVRAILQAGQALIAHLFDDMQAGAVTKITGIAPIVSSGGTTPAISITDFVASGASHARGAVPDPGPVVGTTKYLREDATWAAPVSGPAGATSGNVALFDGTTGDLIKDGGTLGTAAFVAAGINAIITTAKLTSGGSNGSMTFTNGILTAQTPAS